jgi:alpha-beta hydrolase superfamily lysophospholipase
LSASTPRPRPVYLDGVFGMFHAPADATAPGTAVLICSPWGWDEVASYRSRRTWANHLAEGGHPTLRIDLPGVGDSAGSPGDPALVRAWTDAISAGARWLTTTAASGRVAALGLGLGGLLAGVAAAGGAPIDELMLWAAPSQGRQFLRETRAFARLQSTQYGPVSDAADRLPEGWQEIGGFVLSAETIADLGGLDLRLLDLAGVQRALLLDRDEIPVDKGLRARLAETGVDVTVGVGSGWGAMCFHPERYKPPVDVFAVVDEWLASGPSAARRTRHAEDSARPQPRDAVELVVDGVRIRETAFVPDEGSGEAFGILAAPVDGPRSDLCAVFMNAGAVRRIGPNRLWVEAARHWAAAGIQTCRIDAPAIGDAEGDATTYYDVGRFYTAERDRFGVSIMNTLEARGLGRRFVLIGLCAGAYAAFTSATADPRVVDAVVVNPRIMVWDPSILRRRDAQVVTQVFDAGLWRRLLSGETSGARVLEVGRAAAAEASRVLRDQAGRFRGPRSTEPWVTRLEEMLDQTGQNATRVVLAFSGDEPMRDELEAAGLLRHLHRWPHVVSVELPGNDHTLRPVPAQRAFHRLLDEELDRVAGARV